MYIPPLTTANFCFCETAKLLPKAANSYRIGRPQFVLLYGSGPAPIPEGDNSSSINYRLSKAVPAGRAWAEKEQLFCRQPQQCRRNSTGVSFVSARPHCCSQQQLAPIAHPPPNPRALIVPALIPPLLLLPCIQAFHWAQRVWRPRDVKKERALRRDGWRWGPVSERAGRQEGRAGGG